MELRVGKRVAALWAGAWHPCSITAVGSHGHCDVVWEDGTYSEELRRASIAPAAAATFAVGLRVTALWEGAWHPCSITAVGPHGRCDVVWQQDGTYSEGLPAASIRVGPRCPAAVDAARAAQSAAQTAQGTALRAYSLCRAASYQTAPWGTLPVLLRLLRSCGEFVRTLSAALQLRELATLVGPVSATLRETWTHAVSRFAIRPPRAELPSPTTAAQLRSFCSHRLAQFCESLQLGRDTDLAPSCLSALDASLPRLTDVDLSHTRLTAASIKLMLLGGGHTGGLAPRLRSLGLWHVGAKGRVVESEVLRAVGGCARLTRLDLSCSARVADEGLRVLSNGCAATSLTDLELVSCQNITLDGVRCLGAAMPALCTLRLSHSGLGEGIIAALCGPGARAAKLRTLGLGGSPVSLHDVQQLAATQPHLTSLDLAGCAISDKAAAAVALLPHMADVSFKGCHYVSTATLRMLTARGIRTIPKVEQREPRSRVKTERTPPPTPVKRGQLWQLHGREVEVLGVQGIKVFYSAVIAVAEGGTSNTSQRTEVKGIAWFRRNGTLGPFAG